MSITPGFRDKKKFILLALKRPEDTAGTDYIANGAPVIAILTSGLSVQPHVSDQVTRDLDDGLNGGQPAIQVNEMIKISAPFELAGSGTATSPTAWSALMQIAGRDEDQSSGVDIRHNRILNASDEIDATIYFHWEGMYHIALACKASLSRSGKIGERFMGTVEITAVYGDTLEGAPPAADFSGWKEPLPFSMENTAFTLDGQALNLYEYELADNAKVEYDEGTEVKRIYIDDWSEEGKVKIETPDLSTFDPFALKRAGTIVPYSLTHGVNAGQIVNEASTGIQILDVSTAEYKGKQCWEMMFRVIRGNDSVMTTK